MAILALAWAMNLSSCAKSFPSEVSKTPFNRTSRVPVPSLALTKSCQNWRDAPIKIELEQAGTNKVPDGSEGITARPTAAN